MAPLWFLFLLIGHYVAMKKPHELHLSLGSLGGSSPAGYREGTSHFLIGTHQIETKSDSESSINITCDTNRLLRILARDNAPYVSCIHGFESHLECWSEES
ncbi:uncharacterized protein PGTG_15518 [Puccinia graminis f. sp. tritici CRL 75-36-700-3]|uniref:Uncharacterized protein n=1 Tax=Puccinia graminis f. sp. tritici (strain CRL 75-36-700-3 / race SCCL) TaxID=418459 RepID=E3KYE8_PUCGT|nr:uncharacterized protein PGTG_15518 [Puccinia graminis f. sp. tritici CRL 75-36-700-3]EFP89339.1 hypothetical protein PGTG_15518 [Puccinia graminis f. sp. tritici CRL 75-36-700-3]